jgi:ATP-dependent DNA helicase PIF1
VSIPVQEGSEFQQLGQSALHHHQTRWNNTKLLILDEKSMVGKAQMGRCDQCLWQALPGDASETLGGLPTLFLGDFGQLPSIGDTPLFSPKVFSGGSCASLLSQGRTVYELFKQSVTLNHIYCQEGDDPEQVVF